MKKTDSDTKLIRDFFDDPPITLQEMKALAKEERQEIGNMIRETLPE